MDMALLCPSQVVVSTTVSVDGSYRVGEPWSKEIMSEEVLRFSLSHLKASHVSWVPCILSAVLVAPQEELEEEPGGRGDKKTV